LFFSSLTFPGKRVLFAYTNTLQLTDMTALKQFVEAEISASAATVIGS
jgi:hypothetical protein